MKLKLPATNLSYVILCVKYMLNGEELACNMHMLNDNKMEKVEIDTPDGAVVTTVTMNEVTNAQKVVSIQVLYDASEPEDKSEPTDSNLKVKTQVKVKVEKKEDYASAYTSRETQSKSQSRSQKQGKEEKS